MPTSYWMLPPCVPCYLRPNGGQHLVSMWRHFSGICNKETRLFPLSATKYSKTIIFQYFYQDQNRSRLITLECKIKTISSSQYFQFSQIIKPIYIKSVQEPLFYTNSNINLANKEHFGYFKWHRKLNANTPPGRELNIQTNLNLKRPVKNCTENRILQFQSSCIIMDLFKTLKTI